MEDPCVVSCLSVHLRAPPPPLRARRQAATALRLAAELQRPPYACHVAARWGALRVSVYVYNSASDVQRFCAALRDCVRLLRERAAAAAARAPGAKL